MDICVSCMGRMELLELFQAYNYESEQEIYAQMFETCFNIQICQDGGLKYICEKCVLKLRAAADFKRQTQNSLSILLSTKDFKTELPNGDVKAEFLDDSLWIIESEEGGSDHDMGVESAFVSVGVDEKPRKRKSGTMKTARRVGKKANTKASGNKTSILDNIANIKTETNGADVVLKSVNGPKRKKRAYVAEKAPYELAPGELKCPICGQEFIVHKSLKMHMNVHFPNHVCEVCGKPFVNIRGLQRHKTSHMMGPFPCKLCEKEFNNINTMYSHVRYKHGNGLAYRCQLCPQRFPTFNQRLNHLMQLHGQTEKKYKCPHCDKSYMVAGDRSKHIMYTHLKLKRYECSLCSMCFMKKHRLAYHMADVHLVGEKKFPCHLCPKRFSRKVSLQEHVRSHLNDRRFSCELCGRSFVQKCSLKGHMTTHERRGELK